MKSELSTRAIAVIDQAKAEYRATGNGDTSLQMILDAVTEDVGVKECCGGHALKSAADILARTVSALWMTICSEVDRG